MRMRLLSCPCRRVLVSRSLADLRDLSVDLVELQPGLAELPAQISHGLVFPQGQVRPALALGLVDDRAHTRRSSITAVLSVDPALLSRTGKILDFDSHATASEANAGMRAARRARHAGLIAVVARLPN